MDAQLTSILPGRKALIRGDLCEIVATYIVDGALTLVLRRGGDGVLIERVALGVQVQSLEQQMVTVTEAAKIVAAAMEDDE